jgi:hypothetical protein
MSLVFYSSADAEDNAMSALEPRNGKEPGIDDILNAFRSKPVETAQIGYRSCAG